MTQAQGQPFYFGPPERPLFGWLHRPVSGTLLGLGLIICSPIGYEEICAHRSIKHLAQAAARAGIPAVRFDYDGIGDSAGSDFDPDRVPAWLNSIQQAADALRRETGVERLCLAGVRLGATLATLAAARRPDVEALIALAPVISGKGYVRELRALQRMMGGTDAESPQPSDGILEAAGFLMTESTQAALSTIDLMRQDQKPANHVLILDRTDRPDNESWAQRLCTAEATVERSSFDGYGEMMLDAHESTVPQSALEHSIAWLRPIAESCLPAARGPAKALATTARLPAYAQGQPTRQIEETAVHFGDDPPLFGILSAPGEPDKRTGKAILMLNSGAVHHVGPNRLYVTLARRWAALGHVVLRMDVSGIGESAPRQGEPENVVYSTKAGDDVRAAVAYLRDAFGVIEVHALGLCSGAYHAFKAAVAGQALTGVVLINPLTFFWKEGMSLKYPEYRVAADVKRYRSNMWRLQSWRKLIGGNVNVWELSQVLLRQGRTVAAGWLREFSHLIGIPLPEDLGHELKSLAKRSTGLTFVFAAQDPGLELLNTQGGSIVRRLQSRQRLDIHIVEGANHTFTERVTRTRLIEILGEKLDHA